VHPLGRLRDNRASKSDLKHYAIVLALRETFKGWIAKKEATCATFFDLTNRAIEVKDRNVKAKAMEAEAKLLAEERESDHVC
jgi:hypothetical protein